MSSLFFEEKIKISNLPQSGLLALPPNRSAAIRELLGWVFWVGRGNRTYDARGLEHRFPKISCLRWYRALVRILRTDPYQSVQVRGTPHASSDLLTDYHSILFVKRMAAYLSNRSAIDIGNIAVRNQIYALNHKGKTVFHAFF